MSPQQQERVLDLLDIRVTVQRWHPCPACGGHESIRGRYCPTCHRTRRLPQLRVEGVLHEDVLRHTRHKPGYLTKVGAAGLEPATSAL